MNKTVQTPETKSKQRTGNFIKAKNTNTFATSLFIQPKLTIGKSNDSFEKEADSIAARVVNMSTSDIQANNTTNTAIQRKEEESQEKYIQKKSIASNISTFIQPSRNGNSKNSVSTTFHNKLATSKGSGSKMDTATQSFMENRFGTNFSNVRIHTNTNAVQMSKEIGARAFTNGNDIYFNNGNYNPTSTSGKFLLAHELTHTVQQNKNNAIQRQAVRTTIIQKDDEWTEDEIKSIQKELKRIGLYNLSIDGDFGDGSRIGLIEAYGGDAWQKKPVKTIISDLKAAKPVAGTKGEHNLRYGEMFKDGILDFTIGIGYDETGAHTFQISAMKKAITDRGFTEPSKLSEIIDATAIYLKAGRQYPASGIVYVKKNALTYNPPVGAPRKVHAIIRLIVTPTGTGGAAASKGFQEGMVQSDVTMYGGHGRYGTGPDFDRNMKVDLLDKAGKITHHFDDYKKLEEFLEKESKSRTAWQQFEWRHKNNRIKVHGSNTGNVYLNTQNPHKNEFGANLMYWNMKNNGASLTTGKKGSLNSDLAANPEKRYRLWVFNGCRTQDYQKSIRATPNIDKKSTDVMMSTRTLYWSDIANTLMASVDGILNQSSAEKIVTDMDAQNMTKNPKKRGAFKADGISDNPVIK